ncbi:YbaB/EbfC family nucleoid-associated protein [Nonomuraea sp. NPDC003707]
MMDFERELGPDPERLAADADRFFGRLGRLPDSAATARAESRDGWVSVEYSSASGVTDLRLDPRAMRMESARLAETILGLIHQAREHAEAERRRDHRPGTGPATTMTSPTEPALRP